MNVVIFMGRLTADTELKTTAGGNSVLSFNLAVDRDFVAKGEERKTDFIPCVAWKGTAEFIDRYFAKGDMIALHGSWQTRNYEDKNGNKRTAHEMVVDRAFFCGGKKEPIPARDNTTGALNVSDDDLPF